ncbi:hypothetical protein NW752_001732 [Fusarium irregulare]|nr:hypothetical protein NW752_001732 [Fusarium irregulare]
MALIVLILLSAGFYWSWSQDPEMASLVVQGPGSVGRNSNEGHKYCALVVFFLMMLRGCILGGLQTYNSVQVGLLLACEALHLASMVYWAGFSHFVSLPGILSMTRIALFSLHIGFLPVVTDHSGRMLVAYIILCGHLVVLIFVFSIPTAFDVIKLAFSNHPCVISDVENDRGAVVSQGLATGRVVTNKKQAADASTSEDDNELAKYPLSYTSRSSRTLLDMIASRETKLFSHKSTTRISPELLSLFMRTVQGEDKLSHVCEVSREFTGSSSTLVGSTQSDLEIQPVTDTSPDALAAHLLSDNNTAIRSIPTSHDLNRPINEYFISTSHNTYLLGRQVAARSKLEGYVEALSRGCRSVEVDCWNGQRGQPIVKHGYSLTKSINFRDVIKTIKEHAFAASDLPLWLSLEVHCNNSQRDMMARIMVEVFGECLVTEPIPGHSKTLPSPNQLRGRILLKVKMPQGANPQDSDQEDEDAANLDLEQNGDQVKPDWGVQVDPVIPQSEQNDPQEDLLQSLAIYGAGKRLPAPDAIDTHRNFIYSISETNLRKRINKEHTLGLTDTQHMVRVYPDPTRVNSSNFDPLECWKHGVQMAALNYQTDDFQTKLNDAMFACSLGYVLKAQPEPKQIHIAIDVLMAKDLQGLEGEGPLYVELELLLPDMSGQKPTGPILSLIRILTSLWGPTILIWRSYTGRSGDRLLGGQCIRGHPGLAT